MVFLHYKKQYFRKKLIFTHFKAFYKIKNRKKMPEKFRFRPFFPVK